MCIQCFTIQAREPAKLFRSGGGGAVGDAVDEVVEREEGVGFGAGHGGEGATGAGYPLARRAPDRGSLRRGNVFVDEEAAVVCLGEELHCAVPDGCRVREVYPGNFCHRER